ncbi:hypothetical protein BDY21DRAFT_157829 [Lineolata rhizophorae]|uniref:Uncharacterized protein n=1 Tax=Lineolata rhizophorae TaxID=578093 RepID=A0A6A6NLG6_9PEZI|nr:hypothetical protein BDY21DRAFT_157829 [Lineolata rhizophorae]
MSQPYQSPLDRKPPAGGPPPSFKTNVNRSKTKKWVEAKQASYDGDDWGDEYDEYGGPEEPPLSPPPSRPTGFRQRGQGVPAGQPMADPGRNITSPDTFARHRTQSFDADDERRNFSSPAAQQFPPQVAWDASRGYPPQSEAPGQLYDPNRGMHQSAGVSPYQQHAPAGIHPQPRQPHTRQTSGPLHVQTSALPDQAPPADGQGSRQSSHAWSHASEGSSGGDPQQRRDFSPSALPPPLHTRVSPAPASSGNSPATAGAVGARYPPRKSSLSMGESPVSSNGPQLSPVAVAGHNETSPTPPGRERTPSNSGRFIRPADIYKRMEEERQRERASMDSQRPSLDSQDEDRPAGRRSTSRERRPLDTASADSASLKPTLEPVAERKSEYGFAGFSLSDVGPAQQPQASAPPARPESYEKQVQSPSAPLLPEMRRASTFGDDFLTFTRESGDQQAQQNAPHQPVISQPRDDADSRPERQTSSASDASQNLSHAPSLGFRSAVKGAFDNDTTTSESTVSRSNTDSTAGISPIMSRVPSAVTAAARAKAAAADSHGPDAATPMIAEEVEPQQQRQHQIPRKPSPAHSRNVSAESYHTRGSHLGSPSPSKSNSPARSPVLHQAADAPLPEPEAGELDVASPAQEGHTWSMDSSMRPEKRARSKSPAPATGSGDMTTREADIARELSQSPEKSAAASSESSRIRAAQQERDAQDDFLVKHPPQLTTSGQPRTRSNSPTKSRVMELAGKFDAESRRNSAASMDSWERTSQTSARDPSPERRPPPVAREQSFRPPLPGTWQSFATTQAASTPGEEEAKGGPTNTGAAAAAGPKEDEESDVDLAPTTRKEPLHSKVPIPESPALVPTGNVDPMAALKNAGNAMGEAILASVGQSKEEAGPTGPASAAKGADEHGKQETGNIFSRPLPPERMETDTTVETATTEDSVAPTPPPKDTSLESPPVGDENSSTSPTTIKAGSTGISEHGSPHSRPPLLPQLSTEPTAQDEESDRLRKEIVQSLSPTTSHSPSQAGHLAPESPVVSKKERESSILPREYDSYWAGSHRASEASQVNNPGGNPGNPGNPENPSGNPGANPGPNEAAAHNPERPDFFLHHRYSWEQDPKDQNTSQQENSREPASALNKASSKKPEEAPDVPSKNDAQLGASAPAANPAPKRLEPADDQHPRYSGEGLHVVNVETLSNDPETPKDDLEPTKDLVGAHQPSNEMTLADPNSPVESRKTSEDLLPASHPPLQHQSQSRLPPFREILAIKSAPDRIATYNDTRTAFATTETGLSSWVNGMLATYPEHDDLRDIGQRPQVNPAAAMSGSIRHKHGPSLSLFSGALRNPSAPAGPSSAGDHQHVADPQSPGGAGTPTTPAGERFNRQMQHAMQTRGKDLLHSAGVLGGKGAKGAKGLLAKGRSKLRAGSDGRRESVGGSGGGEKVGN